MEELIPLYQGSNGATLASARDLHAYLESKQDFTNWIKGRIATYDFTEGIDFSIELSRSAANRQTTEYAITLDMAKELSMVEGNAKGKQARRYFIERDKQDKARQARPPQLTTAELVLQLAQQNVATEQRMAALEQRMQEAEARALLSNTSYYAISGFAALHKRRLTDSQANHYGRLATALSKRKGYAIDKVRHATYGHVNAYHVDILTEVFEL